MGGDSIWKTVHSHSLSVFGRSCQAPVEKERSALVQESTELLRIFSAIIDKSF
jgi:hypothetical protein